MLAYQNHYTYTHIGHKEPTWNTLPQHHKIDHREPTRNTLPQHHNNGHREPTRNSLPQHHNIGHREPTRNLLPQHYHIGHREPSKNALLQHHNIGHREPTWNTLPQHHNIAMHRPYEQMNTLESNKLMDAMFERPAKRKYNYDNSEQQKLQQKEQRQKVLRTEITQNHQLPFHNNIYNYTHEERQQQPEICYQVPRETPAQQFYRMAFETPHLLMPSFPNLPLTPLNLALILREQMAAMQIKEQLIKDKLIVC